jgi:hypothetical protein
MLGRPAETRRHSLAQLSGVYTDRASDDKVILSLFSYRSLLMFKLIKEMPMSPRLGLLTARLLLSALTIVGVHHPDRRTPAKTMTLRGRSDADRLEISYATAPDEQSRIDASIAGISGTLREIGCLALGRIAPGNGSSIHYAGALGITGDRTDVLGTDASGRLHRAPSVYVGDSANWRFLPAKGLTLSLMANARRVAAAACKSL